MADTRDDHGAHGEQRANPQAHGDLSNVSNLAVKQRNIDNAYEGRDEGNLESTQVVPYEAQVLREPDVTRRDFQRPTHDELPNEEKCHEAAKSLAAKSFPKINVSSARSR